MLKLNQLEIVRSSMSEQTKRQLQNWIGAMSSINDPSELLEIDRPVFESWLETGLVQPCTRWGYRITPAGEKAFWSMFEPGARAREVASLLDENIWGILPDLEAGKSLSEVAATFEVTSNQGLILTSNDLVDALLRWQCGAPEWAGNDARLASARVLNAIAATQQETKGDEVALNYDIDLIKTGKASIEVKLSFGVGEYRAEIIERVDLECMGLALCDLALLQAYECLPKDGYPDSPRFIELNSTSDASSVRRLDEEGEGVDWLNRYLIGFEVLAVELRSKNLANA